MNVVRAPDEGNEFCRPASPETLARVTAFDTRLRRRGSPSATLAGPLGTAIGTRTYLTHSTADIFIAGSAFTLLRPLRTGTGTTSHPQTSGEPVANETESRPR